MTMSLKNLIDHLLYDQQETILSVDGLEVRGTAEALSATLSDEVMGARMLEINVVDGALKVFATVEEGEHATD